MPNPDKKQTLIDAISQIRSAEQLLIAASRSASDPVTLIQINTEYSHLDSYLSQMLHAQALTDDTDFGKATTALKSQISALTSNEESIKKIIGDVASAAKILGYLTKAVEIIGTL